MSFGFHHKREGGKSSREMTSDRERSNMSFFKVNALKDEERLLENMVRIRGEIRAEREKKRKAAASSSEKYSKIFQPVTNSIKQLQQQGLPGGLPGGIPPAPPSPTLSPPPSIKEEEKFFVEPNNETYRQALMNTPEELRSDGVLGLNTETHTIGDYYYEVEGDILYCNNDYDTAEFHIDSLDLWQLLLVKNPARIELKLKTGREYRPFVYKFKDIADRLQLQELGKDVPGFHVRKKAKLLKAIEHSGTGFLFTKRPPQTVVVPSDDRELMNALAVAIAELRAGNTSMQNLVVPLAQEARRRGIPTSLSPEEETWVFA